MDLTQSYVKEVYDMATQYDSAKDMPTRVKLGAKLDAVVDSVSEGQMRQLVPMLLRMGLK